MLTQIITRPASIEHNNPDFLVEFETVIGLKDTDVSRVGVVFDSFGTIDFGPVGTTGDSGIEDEKGIGRSVGRGLKVVTGYTEIDFGPLLGEWIAGGMRTCGKEGLCRVVFGARRGLRRL